MIETLSQTQGRRMAPLTASPPEACEFLAAKSFTTQWTTVPRPPLRPSKRMQKMYQHKPRALQQSHCGRRGALVTVDHRAVKLFAAKNSDSRAGGDGAAPVRKVARLRTAAAILPPRWAQSEANSCTRVAMSSRTGGSADPTS